MRFSGPERTAALLAAAAFAIAPATAQSLEAAAAARSISAPAAAPAARVETVAAGLTPSFVAPALLAPSAAFPAAASAAAPTAFSAAAAEPMSAAAAPQAAAATDPYARAELADAIADPVLTKALSARAERVWSLTATPAPTRRAFAQALEAADYSGAREILDGAARGGGRGAAELPEALARLRRALDLPDHPAVADVRLAAREARELHAAGRAADAMERVDAAQKEFAQSPAARTTRRWELRAPLIKLAAEIRKRAFWVYDAPREARVLALPGTPAAVRGWLARRRAADPASVAGDYTGEKISLQKWSDCELQAIWNLPALRSLHKGRTYEQFLVEAEKILRAQPRQDGMNEFDAKRLLAALGWKRGYDAAPQDAASLARQIADNGGVIGTLAFDTTRWQAFLTTFSFETKFSHAVALPAAVFDRGRWWFVVLDSNYSAPRVLSYGELLTLGLKTATVAPAR